MNRTPLLSRHEIEMVRLVNEIQISNFKLRILELRQHNSRGLEYE